VATRRPLPSGDYVGAGVIVMRGTLVLGITRGAEMCAIELPGGTVDATDSSIEYTAVRELYEETGVVVAPKDLRYIAENPGPRGAYVTFVARNVKRWPKRYSSEPFEGYVGFFQPEAFVNPRARFRDYVQHVFEKVGLL
jgi:8-oxo-dGTP pyrophosphatase MutT (NUDIX family)